MTSSKSAPVVKTDPPRQDSTSICIEADSICQYPSDQLDKADQRIKDTSSQEDAKRIKIV